MTIKRYIGVDGCKAGWFAVVIGSDDSCEFGVFESIADLWRAYRDAAAILIDIPIGLISGGASARACDAAARKALSPLRHNSVFSPPCRESLSAGTYEDACRINQKVCGKKISRQAWGIFPKIKQVDDFLQRHPEAIGIVRETHPEICFWALNGCAPMGHKKKSAEGEAERLDLLKQAYPVANAIYKAALDRYPRKDLSPDDIIDALVNTVTATLLENAEGTFPADPSKDALGLPMEMVFARPPGQDGDTGFQEAVGKMIGRIGTSRAVFPETEIYNETWMLRLVLYEIESLGVPVPPLGFFPGSRWFSEGRIPSPFLARRRGDNLAETWTHADGLIGHFEVGTDGRTDVHLAQGAAQLVCVEAKMFSRLSAGVSNAPYYNQAARYMACMAELLMRANQRPDHFKQLGFVIIAPEAQIRAGAFLPQATPEHIQETVKRRVADYQGEKDRWFKEWFLPLLEATIIECISWESVIERIVNERPAAGKPLQAFYRKCLEYNASGLRLTS